MVSRSTSEVFIGFHPSSGSPKAPRSNFLVLVWCAKLRRIERKWCCGALKGLALLMSKTQEHIP